MTKQQLMQKIGLEEGQLLQRQSGDVAILVDVVDDKALLVIVDPETKDAISSAEVPVANFISWDEALHRGLLHGKNYLPQNTKNN